MPSRTQQTSKAILSILRRRRPLCRRQYATAAAAYAPVPSHPQINRTSLPIASYPTNQPPSYKAPEFRKSQLLRSYASLLRSTPLMLLFQHNNLKSSEWAGIRRELNKALQKVDEARMAAGKEPQGLTDGIKLQIIKTGIFATALKIVEFFKPEEHIGKILMAKPSRAKPLTPSSASLPIYSTEGEELTHTLSEAAHDAIASMKIAHDLDPLLSGPLVLLIFPTVSPQCVKIALSVLSPSQPNFPAPTRRANPGWHDPAVQAGVQKLLLLGARVEGKVLDVDGTKWVGGIEGGMDGLRGQLVALLQSIGGGLTNTLENVGKSLYVTVEGRRTMLKDEQNATSKKEPNKEPNRG